MTVIVLTTCLVALSLDNPWSTVLAGIALGMGIADYWHTVKERIERQKRLAELRKKR
jgi:hypothetical protein